MPEVVFTSLLVVVFLAVAGVGGLAVVKLFKGHD